MKKDLKENRLQIRLTNQEKEQIRSYAESHNLTMSDAVRELVFRVFATEEAKID